MRNRFAGTNSGFLSYNIASGIETVWVHYVGKKNWLVCLSIKQEIRLSYGQMTSTRGLMLEEEESKYFFFFINLFIFKISFNAYWSYKELRVCLVRHPVSSRWHTEPIPVELSDLPRFSQKTRPASKWHTCSTHNCGKGYNGAKHWLCARDCSYSLSHSTHPAMRWFSLSLLLDKGTETQRGWATRPVTQQARGAHGRCLGGWCCLLCIILPKALLIPHAFSL